MGLRYALGEYIVFIDSDDWIYPNYLESMLMHFSEDIDVLIGQYYCCDTYLNKMYIPGGNGTIERTYSGGEKMKEIVEYHLLAYPRKGFEPKGTLMPVWKNMYRSIFIKK